MSTVLLNKLYDGEGLSDMTRDIHEAFIPSFTPEATKIMDDQHGIPKGHFRVIIMYIAEDDCECTGL